MPLVRALVLVLLLGTVARAQIVPPSPCDGAVIDRERFRVRNGLVVFHLRLHTDAGRYDARSVVRITPRGDSANACSDGEVLDRVIDELTRERQHFLDP